MIRRALVLGAALAVVAFAVMAIPSAKEASAIGGCRDVNGDGIANIEDIKIVLSWFGGPPAPSAAADVDGDNDVDFADIAAVLTGPPPFGGPVVGCQASPVSSAKVVGQVFGIAGAGTGAAYTVRVRYIDAAGVYQTKIFALPGIPAGTPAAFATAIAGAIDADPALAAAAAGPNFAVVLPAGAKGLLLDVYPPPGPPAVGAQEPLTSTEPQKTFNPTISILSTGGVAEDPDLSALPAAVDESESGALSREMLGAGALALLFALGGTFVAFRKIGSRRTG